MTAIKKLIDGSGNQYFPQTHTNAVIDDQGNSVESVLKTQTDLINQAQMEVGAVPSDIYPTAGSTNWATSGGIKSAIDTATAIIGAEEFDLESATVGTNNSNYITPSKTENGGTWTIARANSTGRVGHITLPSLVSGKTYTVSFDYASTLTTTATASIGTFGTATANGTPISAWKYQFGTIAAGGSGSYTADITWGAGFDCIVFYFTQPAVNQTISISNISIMEKSSLKEKVDNIYETIHDEQSSTVISNTPVSSGFLNADKTRIRILYNCGTHGRVTARYDNPPMQAVQVIAVSSYDTSTGTIDSSNTIKTINLSEGIESVMEWDDARVRYILINAFTGSTMTDDIYNTFVENLSITIEDLVGYEGLIQRVETVEESVSQIEPLSNDVNTLDNNLQTALYGSIASQLVYNDVSECTEWKANGKKRFRLYYSIPDVDINTLHINIQVPSGYVAGVYGLSYYDPSTGTLDSTNTVVSYGNLNAYQHDFDMTEKDKIRYVLLNIMTSRGGTFPNDYDETCATIRENTTFNVTIDVADGKGIYPRLKAIEDSSGTGLDMVNDGVTDATSTLQAILNNGGTIRIPNGTYLITSSLRVYSNTHIVMEPNAVILRGSNTIKSLLFSWYEPTTTGYNGQKNIVIEGGVLDLGSGYSQGGCGLGFVHCENLTIRNVTVKHVNSSYHNIDVGGSKNVHIENCVFTDVLTDNTAAEMVQIDATGSYGAFPIMEYDANSACYDNTPCLNVEICGCKFFCNGYSPAIGGHNTGAHKYINIHDNFIYGTGASRVRGAVAFLGSTNATDFVYIHDNFIDDFYYGFQFAADNNIWVKNNILSNIVNLRNEDSAENGMFENNVMITEQ